MRGDHLGQRVSWAALLPFLWLALFFLAPFAIVLRISLAEPVLASPPYTPLLEWSAEAGWRLRAGLDNFATLAGDTLFLRSVWGSVRIAALSTLGALLLGFPLAHAMARAPARLRGPLLLMVMLPFWTSFLIRVYAWIGILRNEGLLNHALLALGVVEAPLTILTTEPAVILGIVYAYLPFMVLPLFASLERQDPVLLEAANDLGATPTAAFWQVTLPLARPGIVAGALLVFIPALGEVVVPDLLGGSSTPMLGRTIWTEFFQNRDWPMAAAIAIVLLVAMGPPLVWLQRAQVRALSRSEG